MNFHSDKWIREQLYKHYKDAKELVPVDHIVGIFYQGSGNYGLDYEDSDVDTKCITTPTLWEVALVKNPRSTTHIKKNTEHIDIKDIRLYIQTFRKQNLNFLEILYTPYFLFPNNCYVEQWNRLLDHREEITHYDPVRSVKSMMGIASEKYFAMEHQYPSRMAWIEKFGYDPKQLHHLLRVEEYLRRYIAGESYGDCLISKQADFLIEVKKGYYDLDEARDVANTTYQEVHEMCDKFIKQHKNDPVDLMTEALLDDVAYEIMKISIKGDFEKE